jgi:hypothetical protein
MAILRIATWPAGLGHRSCVCMIHCPKVTILILRYSGKCIYSVWLVSSSSSTIYACLTELKLHPAITLLCLGDRSTGYNLPSKVYFGINLKFWMEVNHWIDSAFSIVFLWICTKNRLMFVNSTLGGSCKMYFRRDQYYILFFARTYCFCIFAVGHLH